MNDFKNEFNKRIYKYALEIIKFVERLPKDFSSQTLTKQLIRSGTSVSANISKSGKFKKGLYQFLHHRAKVGKRIKIMDCPNERQRQVIKRNRK